MDSRTKRGYLLLADLSGFTAFLTASELEHAHAMKVSQWASTISVRYRRSGKWPWASMPPLGSLVRFPSERKRPRPGPSARRAPPEAYLGRFHRGRS